MESEWQAGRDKEGASRTFASFSRARKLILSPHDMSTGGPLPDVITSGDFSVKIEFDVSLTAHSHSYHAQEIAHLICSVAAVVSILSARVA